MSTQEPKITELEAKKPTQSERFANMVLREFSGSVGTIEVTEYQRTLIQGYFISIDRMLNNSEEERLRKNKFSKEPNALEYKWDNVNTRDLALAIARYVKIGLDMLAPNHLNAIAFKSEKTQKYNVAFIEGYEGIRYIAMKYATEPPINVTTELVYKSDTFEVRKKAGANDSEGYNFEINNPFDRGELIGGFGYI